MAIEPQQNSDPDEIAGVLIFPPIVFALPLVLGWLLGYPIPSPAWSAGAELLGLLLVILSLVPGVWAFWTMMRAGVEPDPRAPTRRLILTGPYRFSRNPIYLCFILPDSGFSLHVGNLWMLLLVIPAFIVLHYGIVPREERYLSRRFGPPYEEYRRRVRRWL